MAKQKIIKAWAVTNQDGRNGHGGILWHGEGHQDGDGLPLKIYSEKQQADKMASRKGLYKVVPVEIKLL